MARRSSHRPSRRRERPRVARNGSPTGVRPADTTMEITMTDMTLEQKNIRAGTAATPSHPCDDETLAKSYRYVRLGMVGLLLAIAAAVTLQSLRQESVLGSISAYYYTPAQAIFVGGLIGLATCMIALRGQTVAEEILLNLGGMFAFVVAIVPTGRDADYQAAVRACRDADAILLTERAAAGLDCPTVQALEQATRENVTNNLSALLLVGVVALATSLYFTWRDGRLTPGYWWGFGLASLLWAVATVARLTALELVIDRAHVVAALLLFACIILVAAVNAYRVSDPGRPRVRQ